ncbi:MAG: hypothetical protein H6819_01970 [Phycisphaerales bacterium]|nr:hypothetical protein [Phycisphaerales bacterium]MCB9857021.1 hypothetical protein [Phycisphaerales bacterium]MCB9861852.1 hypothetical protein [Phycisphaerales bacterium]
MSSPAVDVTGGASSLRVGAAVVSITPEFPVYMAGGLPYRLSLGVHDDLTARAIVLENDSARIALVAVDLIGINYDDVVRIREAIAESISVDYVIVAATHTHNGPDVIGIWSPDVVCATSPYVAFMRERVVEAVLRAAGSVRNATLRVAVGDSGSPPLSRDTRAPRVIDDTLVVWQALDASSGDAIVSCVHYASHPILISTLNFDISGDFPYWLRDALEVGANVGGIDVPALGGICVFFNGALGGRITPANAPKSLDGASVDPAHAGAQAYGLTLAQRASGLLDESGADVEGPIDIRVSSRPIDVRVENAVLNLAMRACFVDRAIRIDRIQSEVGIARVGPLEFFAVPGMLFPELVTGELLTPEGVDYPDAAPERFIRDFASAEIPVVVGLANDMLGYLIPASIWDSAFPYATTDGRPPYGEIVSAGPGTAGVVMSALAELGE